MFRFYRDYKIKNLILDLSHSNSLEGIYKIENLLIISFLAPILLSLAVLSVLYGKFWNIVDIGVTLTALSALVSAYIFLRLPYLPIKESTRRNVVGMLLLVFIIISFVFYYQSLGYVFWLIAGIIVFPHSILLNKTTFAYVVCALSVIGIVTLSFYTDKSINYLDVVVFLVLVILLFFEANLIRLLYYNIIKRKISQFNDIVEQKYKMASAYDEIHKVKEELKKKNCKLLKYNYEINEKSRKLKKIAYFDELTNLPNRKYIEQKELELAESNEDFSLIYIDLDDYKKVNDSYGFEVGDSLLKQVVAKLQSKIMSVDILARIGGDEFALLIPREVTNEDINDYINYMDIVFDRPFYVDNYEMNLSASYGVSNKLNVQTSGLLRAADTALYYAKFTYKSKVCFYDNYMRDEVLDKVKKENYLLKALEKEELKIVYQPLVYCNSVSKGVYGFEALLRWSTDNFGNVPPIKFVPIMEDLGLIHDVGLWVFENVCKKVNEINEKFCSRVCMSVNVSAIQIRRFDFIQQIERILKETGVNPSLIIIELTESTFIDDIEKVSDIILRLKRLGLKIAIDDFGTGYSSLSYIADLPLDTIKIDKSFVDKMQDSYKYRTLVNHIIGIAQSLDFLVLAEGVETEKQVEILNHDNCDLIQGYFYSKPIAEEHLDEYLMQNVS